MSKIDPPKKWGEARCCIEFICIEYEYYYTPLFVLLKIWLDDEKSIEHVYLIGDQLFNIW
jgi:hypothetical protein